MQEKEPMNEHAKSGRVPERGYDLIRPTPTVDVVRKALVKMRDSHQSLIRLHLIGEQEKVRLRQEVEQIDRALAELGKGGA